MALFDDPTLLGDEKKTKDALKAAFAKVNDRGTRFLYYEKIKVGAKEVAALAVVDFAPDFESKFKAAIGKAPLAKGRCHATDRNELAFGAESGTIKLEALKKFMATVSGVRPVSEAVQEAPASLPGGSASRPKAAEESAEGGPVDKAKKTETGATKEVGATPDPELLKRLAEFNAEVKRLPADLRDSFEVQIKKAAVLIQSSDAKQARAAAKLLDTLGPMLQKAQSRQTPQVDAAALIQAKESVEKAYAALPAQPPGLRSDIEAMPEAKAFGQASLDPAQARLALAASTLLVKKIADTRVLAEAWPATVAKAGKEFDEAFKRVRTEFDKSGPQRIDAHLQHPAALRVKQLCGDPGAYAKGNALQAALQQQAQALAELADKARRWDAAVKQTNTDVKGDLDALPNDYKAKVQGVVMKDPLFTAVSALTQRGKNETLDPASLAQPVSELRKRITALADEEARRIRAADVKQRLVGHRPAVQKAVQDCIDLVARASAALPALEATWRTPTVQADLTNYAATVGGWRDAATTLRDDLESAVTALGAEPPPAAVAITNAEALLGTPLPDLAATSQRVQKNLATTSANGILAQLETMFDTAKANQHLSNTRVGNLRAALKKTPTNLAQAQQAITDAVYQQNHPKPGEWLKVLQLPNVKASGDLRVAKVGDLQYQGKRIPVHLTLYLANVDVNNAPHLGMTSANIIDAMLPDVVGNLGTHVTAEIYGDKDQRNPHYFKGAAAGVANGLAGHDEWGTIEQGMSGLLTAEIVRLTNLVTLHVARHGVWPGE